VSKRIEIRVPDIGDFRDIPVIELLVAEGDRVAAEDSLVTLESDKATMEVPSPAAGVIRELKVKLDDTVSEGDVVAVIEVDEGAAAAADEPAAAQAPAPEATATEEPESAAAPPAETAPEEPPAPEPRAPEPPAAAVTGQRPSGATAVDPARVPHASPAVRQYARELGVDLHRVAGSGNKGRITRDDVTAFVKQAMTAPAPAAAGGRIGGLDLDFPELQMPDFSRFGDVERQSLTRIQKISAGHLHRNWVGIPHVTQHDEADITDMEAFRKANVEDAQAQGFKLTPLVFLIKAMVASLKKFPRFNASLDSDGETLILKRYYNVGVAVDTPDGLVVPVIRDCDRKGIMELAAELAEVSARAREQKLKPADIQGGCISISSLGGIGGTAFTPIINAPEVAILGVSRSRMKPVWDGENFQPRLMLPLSLSYDHRVIDGAAAARFVRFLGSRLEDLRRLTL
jgi:pyruvate dehydrogenase E2 component (dihydrolipoamide acetyltransferase)